MLHRRDQRRVQRFPVRLPLFELNGQPAPDSYMVDISSLGAQLESPMSFGVNVPVDFVVRFPWMENELRLGGKIRWVKPLIGKPGRFRMGLSFFNPYWELDTLAREGKLPFDTIAAPPNNIQ
jgi:hypothetical protein